VANMGILNYVSSRVAKNIWLNVSLMLKKVRLANASASAYELRHDLWAASNPSNAQRLEHSKADRRQTCPAARNRPHESNVSSCAISVVPPPNVQWPHQRQAELGVLDSLRNLSESVTLAKLEWFLGP